LPSKSSRRNLSEACNSLRIVCESPANLATLKDAVAQLEELTDPMPIVVLKGIPKLKGDIDEIAGSFVTLRLANANKRDERAIDSFAIREFERRVIEGSSRARGVPYEGVGLMKLYHRLLLGSSSSVIVTDRLVMTWSDDDLRYHARVAVFGFPSVISMSGLVEAPARPKEYYLAKQAIDPKGRGISEASLAEEFSGRFLESDDERTPTVLKGYLLQCLFYANTLEPFCKKKDCMLYNAHWQEEMLHAQVESGKLCRKHAVILKKIILEGSNPVLF